MLCSTGMQLSRTAPQAAASPAAGRRQQHRQRRPLVTTAAVQPDKKENSIKIDVFETMGAPAAPSSNSQEGEGGLLASWLSSIDTSEPGSFDGEEKTEYDPLRDGPLRYLGYANECGEAFAAWLFPGGVTLSYAIAIGYVLFDTYDKWQKTLGDSRVKLMARPMPASVDLDKLINTIGLERGLDTLVWQLIASVTAPGYTIHTVVAAANWVLLKAEESQQVAGALQQAALGVGMGSEAFLATFNKSVPTALGLLAIPFIVHPIDGAVHAALNATLRPAMRRVVCQASGGKEAGLAICDCEDK